MKVLSHTIRFAAACIALALAACGGGSGGGGAGGGMPPVGTVVGAAGGTVSAGGATITIPAGALNQDTTITITTSSPNSSLPESSTVQGLVFDFGPNGTTFSTPATLTLPMVATLAANERAVVSFLDPVSRQWVDLPSTVTGSVITAPVSHFTPFAARLGLELINSPERFWSFHRTRKEPSWGSIAGPLVFGEQAGGEVKAPFLFGGTDPTFEQDNGESPARATGEVFSSPSGETFWAFAEAPGGDPNIRDFPSGGVADLRQFQSYVKRSPNATLRVIVSAGFLSASDHNGKLLPSECWRAGGTLLEMRDSCWALLTSVRFQATAYKGAGQTGNQPRFFDVSGGAEMYGFDAQWQFFTRNYAGSLTPLWTQGNFVVAGLQSRDPQVSLNGDVVLDIDLSSVEVCAELKASLCEDKAFTLFSFVKAEAWNWRGRESGAAAYLRDPQKIGGGALRMTGLEATNKPLPLPPAGVQAPLSCATGPDPAAGVLQFSAATYQAQESRSREEGIVVTRTQGSKGAVSVTFSASDNTAVGGVHYTAPATTVFFADGDSAPRSVGITVLPNTVQEPNRTVNLALSQPGGCAVLGAQASAVLTILDDDEPVSPPSLFTVGGTVNGLLGKLVLENHRGLFLQITGDGPFTFSDIPTPSGQPYLVRVFNQPFAPVQFCTVSNGTGIFGNSNVTNVQVNCV